MNHARFTYYFIALFIVFNCANVLASSKVLSEDNYREYLENIIDDSLKKHRNSIVTKELLVALIGQEHPYWYKEDPKKCRQSNDTVKGIGQFSLQAMKEINLWTKKSGLDFIFTDRCDHQQSIKALPYYFEILRRTLKMLFLEKDVQRQEDDEFKKLLLLMYNIGTGTVATILQLLHEQDSSVLTSDELFDKIVDPLHYQGDHQMTPLYRAIKLHSKTFGLPSQKANPKRFFQKLNDRYTVAATYVYRILGKKEHMDDCPD